MNAHVSTNKKEVFGVYRKLKKGMPLFQHRVVEIVTLVRETVISK